MMTHAIVDCRYNTAFAVGTSGKHFVTTRSGSMNRTQWLRILICRNSLHFHDREIDPTYLFALLCEEYKLKSISYKTRQKTTRDISSGSILAVSPL